MPFRPRGDAAAAPAVAGDDERAAREQDVGGADDPVDRRLARAVAVVEQVLRVRLVDGDDREAERAVALERAQADDAGGRLLGAGDHVDELLAPVRVQDADHVGAVVHRDLRLVVDRGLDVLVVGVVVLALDGEDGDVVLVDERSGDVVLRGQRVRRAQHDVRAAGLQRAGEVGGLGGDVQAGGDAVARQRLLGLEALADRGEHRHLPVGPRDPPHAFGGERQVLHVVTLGRCHGASSRSGVRRPGAVRACAAPTPPRRAMESGVAGWPANQVRGRPAAPGRRAGGRRRRRRRSRRRSAASARRASAAGSARAAQ